MKTHLYGKDGQQTRRQKLGYVVTAEIGRTRCGKVLTGQETDDIDKVDCQRCRASYYAGDGKYA